MGRLFGTDGVRGEANVTLLPELAYRLGRAATLFFGRNDEAQPVILIGRDTRISGEMFEAALSAGIASAGGMAISVGVAPTPAVAYLSKRILAKAGVVISASHNPFYDNGIKFFGGDGYKLPDNVEDDLERIAREIADNDIFKRPKRGSVGNIEPHPEFLADYMDFVVSTASERFEGLHVVLDCANGAAYDLMPKILRHLGAEVDVIGADPNGININDGVGSTHLAALQKAVVERGADIGIAHDGDADRCLCVDERGGVIDGDHLLIICAREMMAAGRLKDSTIVTTVMANIGFFQAAQRMCYKVEVTKVGDRYVLENMLANGYRLGGEQSGHIIFTDYSTTGDGLITALQMLSALKRSGQRASELAALMTSYPQVLVNVPVATKEGWEGNEKIKSAIESASDELKGTGRVLVRPSGTEPLIRVMAEGPDESQLSRLCESVAAVIKAEQG